MVGRSEEEPVVVHSILSKGGKNGTRAGTKRSLSSSDSDSDLNNNGALRHQQNQASAKRVRILDPTGTTALDNKLSIIVNKKVVNQALEEKAAGKTQRFEDIRKKFTINPSDPAAPDSHELRQMLLALTHVVAYLDQSCSSLVYDILRSNWVGRDDQYVVAYLGFLVHLVSAQSMYVPKVVRMLVKHLTYRKWSHTVFSCPSLHEKISPDMRIEPAFVTRIEGLPAIPRTRIFTRVHTALKAILDLVPTAWSVLYPDLQAEFPHQDEKRIYQTTYITNLLQVLEYATASRTKVLGLIIDRIIQIDVQIQVNADDLEEAEGEALDVEISGPLETNFVANAKARMAAELEEHEDSDDSDSESSDDDEDKTSVRALLETADKLDAMLEIVFAYFSSAFPGDILKNPSAESMDMFELLLHFFETTILPTFKSRFTQFIIFWAAQKSPMFTDLFLGLLIDHALDNTKPQVARQAAAAYVASFVARAKTLSRDSIRTVVTILCSWLSKFVEDREIECNGPNVAKFGGFYAVVQTVFYIFCFRWRELRGKSTGTTNVQEEEEEEEEDNDDVMVMTWLPGLNVLERVISSRFNPLKVCSPIVVNQFAQISNHFNFIYCFTIMQRNKRNNLFSSARSGDRIGASNHYELTQLESYFPFDPCKLPLSRHWVDQSYVEWQKIPGMDESDAEDDDEEEEGEEDDDDENSDDSDDSDED